MTENSVAGTNLSRLFIGLCSLFLVAHPLSAYAQEFTIDIPPQELKTALVSLSAQTDLNVLYAPEYIEGLETSGIRGQMGSQDALVALLSDSGLDYEFIDDDTVTLQRPMAQLDETPPGRPVNEVSPVGPNSSIRNRIGVDEILVTAEKRAVSLQRTPISMAAFTSDRIERSVIEDIYDIGLLTPGVIVNKEIVGKIYIRGIGTENLTIGGDPGVAVHLDGAYLARTSAANFDLYDIERVEVLRGPQGTLYGRNATGGSINIISKAPTSEFYARAEAQYGSSDRFRFAGAIGGAVSDNVLVRANIVKSDRDGFTPNVLTGTDLDSEDLLMGRVRVRFIPTDAITFDLIGDFSIDDSKPAPFKQLEFSELFEGVNGAFDPPGLRPVAQDSPVLQEQDQYGITGTLNWDLGPVSLTSISSYRDTDFFAAFDGDATSLLFQNFSDSSQSHQFTQEIRLASNDWDRFNWIVGAYYFYDDGETSISIPIPIFGFDIFHHATIETKAYAIFGQATYKVLSNLNVTAGLRFSSESKEAFQFSDFGFIPPLEQDLDEDSDALTPRFAIEFFPMENVMLYASATRGFKSGGFTFNGFQSSFDPEFVWAYEGGAKTQFWEDRIQTNISGFYYNYTDLQVSKLENNAGVITNAADATIWGGELEVVARPTERIDMNVGFSYLNAEFDTFLTEDPSNIGLGTIDLGGNRLTRSPEFTVTVGGQYTQPISDWGSASLRVDYQHQSKSFFTPFNRDLSAQQPFGLVNANLSFEEADGHWKFAAFIKNAFDKEYFLNILESGVETGKPEGFLAPPRTWGIQLAFVF